MPDGRNNEVQIQVASISALLVMKGYALVGRDKMKDAYDIYYAIRNSDTEALVADCQALLTDPEARQGLMHIASKFTVSDDYGPDTVRRFLQESDSIGDMTPEQIQVDAFFRVTTLLQRLGLIAE